MLYHPADDSYIFVDNVGKYKINGYRLSAEKQKSPNVVTASINIPWKHNRDLKRKAELKPGNWMNHMSENEVQQLLNEVVKEGQDDL